MLGCEKCDGPTCDTSPVCLVHPVSLMQPNTPDRPNSPNEQDRLADLFSILLRIVVRVRQDLCSPSASL
jgi:hypothetical protein